MSVGRKTYLHELHHVANSMQLSHKGGKQFQCQLAWELYNEYKCYGICCCYCFLLLFVSFSFAFQPCTIDLFFFFEGTVETLLLREYLQLNVTEHRAEDGRGNI